MPEVEYGHVYILDTGDGHKPWTVSIDTGDGKGMLDLEMAFVSAGEALDHAVLWASDRNLTVSWGAFTVGRWQ
jgi:hypothetical protein